MGRRKENSQLFGSGARSAREALRNDGKNRNGYFKGSIEGEGCESTEQPSTCKLVNPLDLPSKPLSLRSKLPSCPAIYFVISDSDEILYIGKSINLANRWVQHHRFKQLSLYPNARIAWLQSNEVELLFEIESSLIESFNPLLNRSRVPEPGEINSPVKSPARGRVYHIRFTDQEWERLEREASVREVTAAQVIRDLLKALDKEAEPA